MSLSAGIPLSGNSMIATGNLPSPESLAEFSPGRGSPHHPVFSGEAACGASRRRLSFPASPPSPLKHEAASARSAPSPQPEYRWNAFR
jgi:hypothetical protein